LNFKADGAPIGVLPSFEKRGQYPPDFGISTFY